MKHLLLCVVYLCFPLSGIAQHLVGDVNYDKSVNVVDVSQLVEMIKTNTNKYSDCANKDYVDSLFNVLSKEIKTLQMVASNNYEGRTFDNGHEYVDLGLSVKWATCNIGAAKPGDSGKFFAWGETEPKSDYTLESYFDSSYTKYNDSKTLLAEEDDAAHAQWGGNWRLPTEKEYTELRSNCTWEWTSCDGFNGYRITSKTNFNYIFIPAARKVDYIKAGTYVGYGYLWLNYPSTTKSNANAVSFYNKSLNIVPLAKYEGLPIRPVRP